MGGRGAAQTDEDFSFVHPAIKYLLFFFNALFWIISLVLIGIYVYTRISKQETPMSCFIMDPSILLLVVGVLMFFLTFCGCVGSLRENVCLLQTFCICLTLIFLLQLIAGILGFIFSDKVRYKVTEVLDNAIKHYRDDLDLQNLIDFGQREFSCCGGVSFMDWSQNMYFNCTEENPSKERCGVPFSCCHISRDEGVINTMCGYGMQKLEMIKASDFISTSGCIDSFVNWIHTNLFLLGGIALGLAIPQLVGLVLSQVLINQIKDQIQLQSYNLQHHSDPWS